MKSTVKTKTSAESARTIKPRAAADPLSGAELVTAQAAMVMLGCGPNVFFEVRKSPNFPRPVELPNVPPSHIARFRRKDILSFIESLPEVPPPTEHPKFPAPGSANPHGRTRSAAAKAPPVEAKTKRETAHP